LSAIAHFKQVQAELVATRYQRHKPKELTT
jgi:hypothetical protein